MQDVGCLEQSLEGANLFVDVLLDVQAFEIGVFKNFLFKSLSFNFD